MENHSPAASPITFLQKERLKISSRRQFFVEYLGVSELRTGILETQLSLFNGNLSEVNKSLIMTVHVHDTVKHVVSQDK